MKVLKLGESESVQPRKRLAPTLWRIPPWVCIHSHLRHRSLLRRFIDQQMRTWFRKHISQLKKCSCFRNNFTIDSYYSRAILIRFLFQTRRPSSSSAKGGQSSGRYFTETIMIVTFNYNYNIHEKKDKTDFHPDSLERRHYIYSPPSIRFAGQLCHHHI